MAKRKTQRAYVHPDDVEVMYKIKVTAEYVAKEFGLPLQVVEHKRRPRSGGSYGLCYYKEGRISIVVRYRDAGVWHNKTRHINNVLYTVAHELAHLRYLDHKNPHKVFTSVLFNRISSLWYGWRFPNPDVTIPAQVNSYVAKKQNTCD